MAPKTLHLLRHAKSSWKDEGLDDHERPLAKRGRRAAKLMGSHLRREGIEPGLVLCSSARRTRQTLKRAQPAGRVEVDDGLYAASSAELLTRLRALPDELESVMVIGHNPGLEDLAVELAWRAWDKFPTGALATLTFEGPWRDLGPGSVDLAAFTTPRDVAAD